MQPVEFVPSTAADKSITGSVVVNPMDVGVDAKTKPTSDIEYAFQGEPVLIAIFMFLQLACFRLF